MFPLLLFFTSEYIPTHFHPVLFFIPYPVRQDRSDRELDGWQLVLTLQSSRSTKVKNVRTLPGTFGRQAADADWQMVTLKTQRTNKEWIH